MGSIATMGSYLLGNLRYGKHCMIVPTADLTDLVNEVERLQRIEQAARAHKAAWDDGTNSTMAHDTRAALWATLEGE